MLPFLNKKKMAATILERRVTETGEVESAEEEGGEDIASIVQELRALADRLEACYKGAE